MLVSGIEQSDCVICIHTYTHIYICFPGGSVVKNPPANAGDMSLIPGLGRSPGEVNGNTLLNSCLGNPMDRGARWAIVHGVEKSQARLSDSHTHTG